MLHQIIHRFTPNLGQVSHSERLRASLGALLGIFLTATITRIVVGDSADVPLLVAPMGASAVLLFAAPSSPLGQPWSIIGGNVSAAIVGVTCRLWIGDPFLAAAIAVCVAIAVMFALRCLHPPGGAVAVVSALASPTVAEAGYWFVLAPVGLNSLLLLATALVFNNLTGRRYPHPRVAEQTAAPGLANPRPTSRVSFTSEDLDAVLRQHDEVFDIDRDDLAGILRETELRAYARRSGGLTCRDFMSSEVATVGPGHSLGQAWALLRKHRIKALPVVGTDRALLGIVTQTDFLNVVGAGFGIPSIWPSGRIAGARALGFSQRMRVDAIMTTSVRSAGPETTMAELVPLMADAGLHHLPVADDTGRLVGIVTQSDMIAALFFGVGEEAGEATAAA